PTPPYNGGGGSGGGGNQNSVTAVSSKTKCQLLHYGDLGMQPHHTFSRPGTYRYVNSDTNEVRTSTAPLVNLGSSWVAAPGHTVYAGENSPETHSFMYESAYHGYHGNQITGSLNDGHTSNNYITSMTAEEYTLFVYGHESAHQNGIDDAPSQQGAVQHYAANYYGIMAVKRMRAAKAAGTYSCGG
ncbi:MAG: hypothetical protein WBW92_00990, partial [Rhodanobacteraceae bacterium]